ncbi:MAG: helix-turn-helix domain-containing protein [Lachnospiraceae bacterium]|nr:helix-turn-helix domain-containing protein [Lachnospiraceae bacterium]
MISNQILQSTIDGLKDIVKVDMAVIDTDGRVLASTFDPVSDYREEAANFAASAADSQEMQGCQFFKVYDELLLEYIIIILGNDEDSFTAGKIAAFQIQSLQIAYKERFDKDNFIKNLLLDNLLLVDIYNRSQKLHIPTDVKRVVIVAEIDNYKEFNALESIKNLLAGRPGDFITAVDENSVIVVREIAEDEGYSDISRTAEQIYTLFSEKISKALHVSYGTIVKDIREVSRSYKEAKMALDVGKIFFDERNVIAYSELGIGRLIYQLPIPLCKMFIKEIFDGSSPDDFDEETLTTINKFFENSLNVSETSRQLFIHRNTLVYRLDKLEKSTGLDLRVFEDAITFKISLMVSKYMKYMEDNRL